MTGRQKLLVALLIALITGSVIGRLFPPFILDSSFWRDFWSGPPTAGFLALAGAGVAYGAAIIGSRTSAKIADRKEWWTRAEWALTLARSNNEVDRTIGLGALQTLLPSAHGYESEIILLVSEAVAEVEATSTYLDKETTHITNSEMSKKMNSND